MGLVNVVAGDFRGRGVDFDELLAIGRIGLVEAARTYQASAGKFSAWASIKIRSQIQDDLKSGRNHRLGEEPEVNALGIKKIYEWDCWGDFGNAIAIYERWPDNFDGSPETLALLFDEIEDKQARFEQAFISLSPLQRKLIMLVYLRDPAMTVTEAAYEIRISYLKAWRTLKTGLVRMRKVIASMEANRSPMSLAA